MRTAQHAHPTFPVNIVDVRITGSLRALQIPPDPPLQKGGAIVKSPFTNGGAMVKSPFAKGDLGGFCLNQQHCLPHQGEEMI